MRFFAKVPYSMVLSSERKKIQFWIWEMVEITQKFAKKRHFWAKNDVYVWVNKISSVDATKNLFRYSETSLNYLSGVSPQIFHNLPPSPPKISRKLSLISRCSILVHIKQRKMWENQDSYWHAVFCKWFIHVASVS